MWWLLLLAGLGLGGCKRLPPEQAHFEQAFKAYNRGDFETALLYLKPLVEREHPGAMLLMAKMYANGQGVEHDMGKAELLRNLSAMKIYKKDDLPPGVVRPANEMLKSLSDRLDYYVDPEKGVKGDKVRTLDQLLQSMSREYVSQRKETDAEPDMHPTPPGTARLEVSPEPANAPEPEGGRRADQISLGRIRQAADEGDPEAMELLSDAYAQGYYGLKVDSQRSEQWATRAREARSQLPSGSHENPIGPVPWVPITLILVGGAVLIGVAIWRLWAGRA